ncbi:MAG: YjcQ family protein [Clostridia bacterium]|nr:YjcQ family protein [Clostridia bacterium]
MAKDDYYVIVYQILAYLYRKLKDGEPVEPEFLMHDSPILHINEPYWCYIIENMLKQEFIEGVIMQRAWGSKVIFQGFENCRITPKGIEYLCENSTIKKAYRFLKDAKSIVPFELI